MEMIYGDHYLSPGGRETSAALCELGQVQKHSNVLDLGCGIGGAAFFLAEHLGCSIVGVDLMEASVNEANRRAEIYQISDTVKFRTGDAINLTTQGGQYDIVWGQDAWCHIDDKARLIAEAKRNLRSGGKVVFSDWLLQDKGATYVKEVTASPYMSDADNYLELLRDTGFTNERFVDESQTYALRYKDVLSRLHSIKDKTIDRFGEHVFEIVLDKQETVFNAFQAGDLGAGYFSAEKA